MLKDKHIGFIGTGNMGQALMAGMLDHEVVEAKQIWCSDINDNRLEEIKTQFGVHTSETNEDVIDNTDIIIFAVKPQILGQVMTDSAPRINRDKLIVSIAAGVPLAAMSAWVPQNTRIIRAMPNICVTVQLGMTALAIGPHASTDDAQIAQQIFDAVGRTVVLDSESQMDAVTGLSGSGPAYAFMVLEALADGGVRMGLPRQEALLLASQTLLGAAAVCLNSDKHPGQLKDMITSPGGTTIAGVAALEKMAVRFAFSEAVVQATERSKELGRQLFDTPEKG